MFTQQVHSGTFLTEMFHTITVMVGHSLTSNMEVKECLVIVVMERLEDFLDIQMHSSYSVMLQLLQE